MKIDQICCGVLSRVDGLSFSGGPKPSHYNINQDSQSGLVAKSHPFFVLNLTFPVDSMIDHHRFDLDGSATVLEDSNLVRDCMYLLLKDFYSRYGDVYSTAFEKTWAETGKLSSSVAGTRVVYSQQFMSEKRKIPPSPADSHGIVLSVKSCSKTSTSLAVASDVPERRVLPSLSPLFHVAKSSLLPSSSPWPSPDLHWTNSPWSQYSCNPTSVDKGLRVHSSTGTSDKITTYCFFPDIREKQDSADDFESTFFSPSSNKVTDLFPSTKSTNQNKQCDYFIDENALLPGFGVSVSRRTLPNYEDADYGILHEDLTRSSKLGKTLHQQGRFAVYGPLGGFGTELKLDHSVVGPSVESHPPYHDLIGKLPNDSMSDPPTEYTTQRMDHQQYFLQPLNDSSSLKVHSSVDLDMDFLPAESQLLAKRRYVGGGVNERKMMSPLEAIAIPTRISNTESMINRLDVSDIESCKTIGQFDNKFIFALSQSGTLLGFDQHAVDERVQLEASYNRMCNCGFVCVRCVDFQSSPTEGSKRESLLVVDPPTRISLTESEAHILSLKTNLVRQWGFNVNTISSNYTTDKSEMSKCAKQGKSTVIMEITSFPVFLGESLRVGDLIEFLHWLEQNLDLPLVLLRPPALSRIFASKACRNSIKFGDSLSHMESQELLARLSHTQLPFQCAHGRPSVAPILYLNDILHSRSADKESYENVSCSSCFCN